MMETLSSNLFVLFGKKKNVDFTTHPITHSVYGWHNFLAFLQYFTGVDLKISSPGVTYVCSLLAKTLNKPQVGTVARVLPL